MAQKFSSGLLKIILLSFIPMLMGSCNQQMFYPHIKGSGIIVSENRNIDNYASIDLRMQGNVKISADDRFGVQVSADDNIINEINTFTRNGTLIISGNKNFRNATVDIHVSLPYAEKISVNGSGGIVVGDLLQGEEMHFRVGGSGSITAAVNAEKIYSTIAGSGSLNLSGKAYLQNIQVSGSGNINSYKLNTSESHVKINGSGNSYISVEESLGVKINGSGSVYYKGNPQTDLVTRGSGKVIHTD